MNFLKIIESRHSTRAFDPTRPVSKAAVHSILHAARNAPSSQNNQPWRCIVITGQERDNLSKSLLHAYDNNLPTSPGYKNRSNVLDSAQQAGIDASGKWWYTDIHGIPQEDKDKRRPIYRKNYEFYGAPIHVLLCVPEKSVEGTFLDAGAFLQNILLGCAALGLGAIPQFSVAAYSEVVKATLNISNNDIIVCGISIGYPSSQAVKGGPPRHEVDDFTKWIGFDKENTE
ncbi:Nitroreductase-like domain-containing protein [Rozella allomycis CSF55]|uniref:Nitroreductase-like domain-containing protein n=1 Tax=Rozella allomycis (strain CSF55) TaxID=988480 RepID=A0A075AXK0_ROZAC|nr:Nitroreductase-like domain-containing protein [Rozella allomycis CSF55]|eukprot:EPZ33447.1 Nitroreductase-like domain-containing protein [Rozella allomycis CSF55]